MKTIQKKINTKIVGFKSICLYGINAKKLNENRFNQINPRTIEIVHFVLLRKLGSQITICRSELPPVWFCYCCAGFRVWPRYPPFWQWVCLCFCWVISRQVCITLTIVCLFAFNAAAAVVCLYVVVVVYGGSILICLLFVCLFIVMVVLIWKKKNGKKCNSNRSVKICQTKDFNAYIWGEIQTLCFYISCCGFKHSLYNLSLFLFVCRLIKWVSFYINSFTFVSTKNVLLS